MRSRATTRVFNRTAEKAQSLRDQFGCDFGGTLDAVEPGFDVIVNATSVGMGDELGSSPIASDALKNAPVVLDIVSYPRTTTLMTLAAEQGCQVIRGASMIAYLAVPTLEWLTGEKPSLDVLKDLVSD
jgi:shikimate dehydrogenase